MRNQASSVLGTEQVKNMVYIIIGCSLGACVYPLFLLPNGIGAQMIRRQYANGVAGFDCAVIGEVAFFAAISRGNLILIHGYTAFLSILNSSFTCPIMRI